MSVEFVDANRQLPIAYRNTIANMMAEAEALKSTVDALVLGVVRELEATDAVKGRTDLAVMWLEHLLLLSMLQHASRTWRWGRLVVVHPAGNTDFAEACARYRDLLLDQSTFSSMTVEELLDANVLPAQTTAALHERYLLN